MIDTTWTEFHADGARRAFLSLGPAAQRASAALHGFAAACRDVETREFASLAHGFHHGYGPRSASRSDRRAARVNRREKLARRARRRRLRRMPRMSSRG